MSMDPAMIDARADGPRFLRGVRSKFASIRPGDHKFSVAVGPTRVHFSARIVREAKQLLFTFHGAVDRERHKSAPFNGFFPGLHDTHQIAISDPSLAESRDFRVAWFAGHAGFDTQYHVRGALRTIAKALQIERTIYFGTSAGGFAALYFSYFAPRSIALVFNPQTHISSYHGTLVTRYREVCWPALASNEELDGVTCADLAALYGQGFRNTVIYNQSMGDRHHAALHMPRFVGALAGKPFARHFLLHSDYKGVDGHVSDHPAYLEWVNAVVACPSDDPRDLLKTWHAVRSTSAPVAQATGAPAAPPAAGTPAAAAPAASKATFRPEDLETARRLRAFQEASR